MTATELTVGDGVGGGVFDGDVLSSPQDETPIAITTDVSRPTTIRFISSLSSHGWRLPHAAWVVALGRFSQRHRDLGLPQVATSAVVIFLSGLGHVNSHRRGIDFLLLSDETGGVEIRWNRSSEEHEREGNED